MTDDDPDLCEQVDDIVEAVAAAQEPDGYLNTHVRLVESDKRWTTLHAMHELYCASHLIEAAVAHRGATGEDTLFGVAVAFADHVDRRFGLEHEGSGAVETGRKEASGLLDALETREAGSTPPSRSEPPYSRVGVSPAGMTSHSGVSASSASGPGGE